MAFYRSICQSSGKDSSPGVCLLFWTVFPKVYSLPHQPHQPKAGSQKGGQKPLPEERRTGNLRCLCISPRFHLLPVSEKATRFFSVHFLKSRKSFLLNTATLVPPAVARNQSKRSSLWWNIIFLCSQNICRDATGRAEEAK